MSEFSVESFKNWFQGLSELQKKELINYILETNNQLLNERSFAEPYRGKVSKGLFAGPSPSLHNQNFCPSCGRTLK